MVRATELVAAFECVPAFLERPGPTPRWFYKPLAESRKIGVSPTANVVIGLHRRGGVTAVQADGGRDREKWVVNSRGQMEGAWYEQTLSELLTSVTCHDRQTGTVKISNVLEHRVEVMQDGQKKCT